MFYFLADKLKIKSSIALLFYKVLFGAHFMETLESEDIVSFGFNVFLIAVNGLPEKRMPVDTDSFRFRGHKFNELEGGDFFNLTEQEYLYLLANSVAVR